MMFKAKDKLGIWRFGYFVLELEKLTSTSINTYNNQQCKKLLATIVNYSKLTENFIKYQVNEDTICNSIEFKDINGNTLYTGDFVQVVDKYTCELVFVGYIKYNEDIAANEVTNITRTLTIEECLKRGYYLKSLNKNIKDENILK